MTTKRNGRSPQAAPDAVAKDATMAAPAAADTRKDDSRVPAAAVAEDIHRIESEATPPEPLRDSKPRPGHAYKRPRSRRLGALECTLLVLIALGIAITVVMAIINPSP